MLGKNESLKRLQEMLDNPDRENPLFQGIAQSFETQLIESGVSADDAHAEAHSRVSAVCEVIAGEGFSPDLEHDRAKIDAAQGAHLAVMQASTAYYDMLIEIGPDASDALLNGEDRPPHTSNPGVPSI